MLLESEMSDLEENQTWSQTWMFTKTQVLSFYGLLAILLLLFIFEGI